MKKVILSLLLIGSSCAVFAQIKTGDTTNRSNARVYNDSMNRMNSDSMNRRHKHHMNMNADTMRHNAMKTNDTLSTNRAYSAYGITSANVPSNIQTYFRRDNPSATNVTWQQNGEWYQGTYNNNGHYTHVYYNQTGATYTVSLPVTETYVPDDIISKVGSMFGPTIYDVTTLKSNTDSTKHIYQVRVLENGQLRAQWINEDGSMVADPFRATVESNINTGAYPAMDSSGSNLNRTDTSSMNNMNYNRMNTEDSTRVNTMDSSRMNMNDNNMNNSMDSSRSYNNNMNSTDSTQSRSNYNPTNTTDTSSMVTDTSGNANTNQMKTKIKSKSSDGKKTKTKMKNGEMIKQEE